MPDSVIYTTYSILPAVILALASFFLALIISRITVRKINNWKNEWKGVWIALFSLVEYLFIHISLFFLGIFMQMLIVCSRHSGVNTCDWYLRLPILIGFGFFSFGFIIFCMNSVQYLRKISSNIQTVDVNIRWSKKERKLFFITLAVYIFAAVCLIPIIKLTGYGF